MKQVTGEEAFFTKHDGEKLEGMIGLQVDDFHSAGTQLFHEAVTEKIKEIFELGKVEEGSFRFSGLDVEEKENSISISQKDYKESLKEMEIPKDVDPEDEITKEDYKGFRGLVGKLSWLQGQTRPDLAFDSLLLSMKTRNTTYSDINKINKIVKKQRNMNHLSSFQK